jgi:DNA-binding MarR family transcriptional regulator
MPEVNETMIYEMAFRMRLYLASSLLEDTHNNDLNERESLLLELVGTKGGMSISEICSFYPKVSSSTISTTITRLWKDKQLVDKKILPENQRITTVNLTEKGQGVLRQIKQKQTRVFKTMAASLSLSLEQSESFNEVLGNAIAFFDNLLNLQLNDPDPLGVR